MDIDKHIYLCTSGLVVLLMSTLIHPVSPIHIRDLFGTHSEQRKAMGLGAHRGVDYAVPIGTPLKAIGRGTIVRVYHTKVLGYVVELRTYVTAEKVRVFAYCHLDKVEVKEGQQVKQLEIIGHSGNTGASSGAHLHLMCGKTENLATMPVEDPLQWLPKIGKK
jgi:murein DD-endopeptidase MepM/ murein hydrolase activator NlpD